jgi:hypothetical protein
MDPDPAAAHAVPGGLPFHHVEGVTERAKKFRQPNLRRLDGLYAQNGHRVRSLDELTQPDAKSGRVWKDKKSHAA